MNVDQLAPHLEAPIEWGEIEEPRVPTRMFALKDRDTFLVADAYGDVMGSSDGLFHDDTRILSRWRMLLGTIAPTLLSGGISQDNVLFTAHTLNKALPAPGGPLSPPGVLHIERKRFLWEERLYERVEIVSYSDAEIQLPLTFEFDADFRDMFEVRGALRPRRGDKRDPEAHIGSVRFSYCGLDGIDRTSVIAFSDVPAKLLPHRAEFLYTLKPGGRMELFIEISAQECQPPSRERYRAAAARARFAMRARRRQGARLSTSGRLFNGWIAKSRADLALLTTPTETGPYPYAGIPWFSTAFGRDAIITAWQTLWFEPSLAHGVLTYLAAHQADEISDFRDSQPGKIMHELRRGEMAALGEVPFGRYYGGVDTTPLFICLAGAYADATGDRRTIDRLWPALERAAGWVHRRTKSNPNGLVDYARAAESGLSNQGWKDSGDSVFHADGRTPKGPISLVEVQGYAYLAYLTMARFCAERCDLHASADWARRAEQMRETVERLFWMEDEGFYGMALDGDGELCRVRASNAGHLLFCGLPSRERAHRVAEALLSPDFASGWGIRTLATGQPRFNPMSYHNGSIWPHDTALCAMGLARYGERDGVVRLVSTLFETASELEMRLPELFCGFPRSAGEPPVPYPVACLPQAWAAGSVFMMLQACLGLSVDGVSGELLVDHPRLPIGIDRFHAADLQVGRERTNLLFEREGAGVFVSSSSPRVPLRVIPDPDAQRIDRRAPFPPAKLVSPHGAA
ncbi:amylo-alpha-1,6-glucosidase [Phenylobacterium sp. LjRoot219]|uniref:amylo-alpha-1,6-glucosidase n=1 Tax=Phenylobacterium sp. LjRoot219 TaxID=3342283 RepID=UPI003ED06969